MSLYTDCRKAALALLADPSQAESGREGIFTDLDVVILASMQHGWSELDRRRGFREANQVMGVMFRNREVARYGPVDLESVGLGEPDYVRSDSRIAYANPASGPPILVTPNGTYRRLLVQDDPITKQGRRLGTNRDDFKPWSSQQISQATISIRSSPTDGPLDRRVIELQRDLEAAHNRLRQQEAELHRLRDQSQPATRKDIEELRELVEAKLA